jgi:hypothetical protein
MGEAGGEREQAIMTATTKKPKSPTPPQQASFWQCVFRTYHQKRKSDMKNTLDGLKLGFRPLDFRLCVHFLRKFTELSSEALSQKLGVEPNYLRTMEKRNHGPAPICDKLRDIAHEYYLPEEIEHWFNFEARLIESKRKPTRAETLGGERI